MASRIIFILDHFLFHGYYNEVYYLILIFSIKKKTCRGRIDLVGLYRKEVALVGGVGVGIWWEDLACCCLEGIIVTVHYKQVIWD